MHLADDRLLFSATDLSAFAACPHLTQLEVNAAHGGLRRPIYAEDPRLEALRARGELHEKQYLEQLEANGRLMTRKVPRRAPEGMPRQEAWEWLAQRTHEAMQAGADVVYQAVLFDGQWVGRPDFLRRVDRPSNFGSWSYEIIDTKLARHAKAGAILQVMLYAELLQSAQGMLPEYVFLALGGPDAPEECFRVAEFSAYFRHVKRSFLASVSASVADPLPVPEPVEHCQICDWSEVCTGAWRNVDHLSFVAGITRRQRRALSERGVQTLAGLAAFDPAPQPAVEGISRPALERIQSQARLQDQGRRESRHIHELLTPVEANVGLAALPLPSEGDLFFDIEGAPHVHGEGLEYLFGFVDNAGIYAGQWATTKAEEKLAFEAFVDGVVARRKQHPAMHVYHFAPYETTALKRLMSRYATREAEVDDLLRHGVFVDLHRVVKGALRASVESYSIKKLEPFYGYERGVDLRQATRSMVLFEAWLELGREPDPVAVRAEIQGYNQDDCVSTLALREWLETLRDEVAAIGGDPVPRWQPPKPRIDEERAAKNAEIVVLAEKLLEGVSIDRDLRSDEEHGRWLAAQLLEYHWREDRSTYWEYFGCRDLSDDEAVEDGSALGGLEYVGTVEKIKRSLVHRYRFPPQDHKIKVGSKPTNKDTESQPGKVHAIDENACTIDLLRSEKSEEPHPRTLIVKDIIVTTSLRARLKECAEAVVADGFAASNPFPVAVDLLLRRAPIESTGDLRLPHESVLEAGVRLVISMSSGVLPVQGPPGSGKTYTAARMILAALQAGQKVGISAASHKVIANLLDGVCAAARDAGVHVRGLQAADEEDRCVSAEIRHCESKEVAGALKTGEVQLAAGTAWLWSRDDMRRSVDVLFIDEAGQYTLANGVAVAHATDRLVLVGDPRQLEQPQQGVHPPGSHVSVLDHMIGDADTIAPERGLFLAETWRLHPTICDFTSEIFYGHRLISRPGAELQAVTLPDGTRESGLRYIPVEHEGNHDTSAEEAAVISMLFHNLLVPGSTWTSSNGVTHPLRPEDILVVAPYNAQVAEIRKSLTAVVALPRVGTVDKFQGQEAPVVIYSMATSSPEEAPRGMEFLYSGNRLNVATSRARCLAIVVASPLIFSPSCRTPRQMQLANAFCRYLELAEMVTPENRRA